MNMRTMLQRRKWQATDTTDSALEPLLTNIKAIQAMEKRIGKSTELSELLGIEGNASAAYFGAFNFMLKRKWVLISSGEVVVRQQTQQMRY